MRSGIKPRDPTPSELTELQSWAEATDADRARKGRIVLLAREGMSAREIGMAVGCTPANVKKWLARFNDSGLDGLQELKRGPKKGIRSRFSDDQERAILALAAASPRDLGFDFDRWSPQKLADAAVEREIVPSISHVTVREMMRGAKMVHGPESRPAIAEPIEGSLDLRDLLDEAERDIDAADPRAAVEKLRAALEQPGIVPATEAAVRCRLAEALESLSQYEEAYEVMRRYDDAAVVATLPPSLRGRVKVRLGWIFSWLRNHPRAIAKLNEAIKALRDSGDDNLNEMLAEAYYALGRTYLEIHEYSVAREHLEKAIELQRYSHNNHFLAQVYLRRGTVEFNEGDIDAASEMWEKARSLAEGSHDDNLLGLISMNLGVACINADRGERDRATRYLESAIHHFERGGHTAFLSQAYTNLGDNLRLAGDWPRAIENLQKALELARRVGDLRGRADPLLTIAEIAYRQGRYHDAHQNLKDALELLHRAEDRWGEAYALRVLGGVYYGMKQLPRALRTLRDALHLSTTIRDLRGVTSSHLVLAELYLAEGRLDQAEEYIELARGAIKAFPSQLRASGIAQRLIGRLALARGRTQEAHQHVAQSLSIFTASADQYEVGVSHLEMAEVLGRLGRRDQARQHAAQATEILGRLAAAPELARADELARSPEAPRSTASDTGSLVERRPPEVSDALLMQRLLEASASRDLLLQELVSVLEENFATGRVMLVERTDEGATRTVVAHGYEPGERDEVRHEVEWAMASGERTVEGQLLTLDTRAGEVVALHVERQLPLDRVRPLLRQAELGLENCALRELSRRVVDEPEEELRVESVIPGFIYAGPAMRKVVDQIQKIRTNDVTVLITGESGTGKELVARAIHAESERRRAVFLPFNCTATPKEIIDSQLFGHRRGAFTGATANYPGIIRAAEGGTLFLDEIGDLALEVQPKLLRLLESGEIQPLGEPKPFRVDVRIVAATNSELERAVEEGRFREDLYYRLNIIRVHVPPLRERREEIPVLADYFLTHFAERSGKGGVALRPEAVEVLTNYSWPGNVRQLRNEMERVVTYAAAGARVGAGDLSPELSAMAPRAVREQPFVAPTEPRSLREATARFERELIEEAMERTGGDLVLAARRLGISARGLHVRMAQLGMGR
jgi:transcriptional regulator with GAF, ATPase, and Fis domain/Tfp pilus assembly protein PilF/transposase